MIVEMRTHKLKLDMRARFLEIFRTKSIPEHRRLGMKLLDPYLSIDDQDRFSSCVDFRIWHPANR
jgi:hypothetical protein